jgi:hypothetical protein
LAGGPGSYPFDSAWISSLSLFPLAGRKAGLNFKDIGFAFVRTV